MSTHKPLLFYILLFIMFNSCITVETFIENDVRKDYQPLDKSTTRIIKNKKLIDNYIKENSFFDAVLLLDNNKLVYEYGETKLPMNCASVRKSIFSMLFGIAIEKGFINLDDTLASLNIDDNKQPLTENEKNATVRQLLQSRSGIYLKAGGETELIRGRKPERGAFLPGNHFYYNNWDFNILPIILEKQTGLTLGELIEEWLAKPTGMYSYNSNNVLYDFFDFSEYPQTRLYISAEDLAKVGSLFLTNGQWKNTQVIPKNWTQESVAAVSIKENEIDLQNEPFYDDYAMCWWLNREDNTIWASGFGGQYIIIDKAKNLVMVARNNLGNSVPGFLWYNATSRREKPENAQKVYEQILKQL